MNKAADLLLRALKSLPRVPSAKKRGSLVEQFGEESLHAQAKFASTEDRRQGSCFLVILTLGISFCIYNCVIASQGLLTC